MVGARSVEKREFVSYSDILESQANKPKGQRLREGIIKAFNADTSIADKNNSKTIAVNNVPLIVAVLTYGKDINPKLKLLFANTPENISNLEAAFASEPNLGSNNQNNLDEIIATGRTKPGQRKEPGERSP